MSLTRGESSVFEVYRREYSGKTIGEVLDRNKGAGLGFDLLRLGLAASIVFSHASSISGHSGITTAIIQFFLDLLPFGRASAEVMHTTAATAPQGGNDPAMAGLHGWGRPVTLSHIPMFFALSGFLVAGSAVRTQSLVKFLGLRVIRIVPALFVEVTLSAIILGGVFTNLKLSDYYSSSGFWRYFLNTVGYVNYFLPGVFDRTPGGPIVNANLWTLPFEFECYAMISLIMAFGLLKRPKLLAAFFGVATVVLLIANSAYGFQVTPAQLEGRVMIYYFVAGLIFYVFRYKIVMNAIIFFFCAALSYVAMMSTMTVYIYPLFLTYVTVFIGLFPFPQFKILKTGDYSYGVYLYGFPVTRAFVEVFPGARANFGLVALASLLLTIAFAAFSWHAVEKHFLRLKKFLSPRSASLTNSLHPALADKQ